MKTFKIINSETEYLDTLSRSLELIHAKPGTEDFEEREFLLVLIKDYEYRELRIPVID